MISCMNIYILTPVYLPYVGGTQLAIQSLAHELTMRGHQVTIVTLTPGREIPQNVEERVGRLSYSRALGTQKQASHFSPTMPHAFGG